MKILSSLDDIPHEHARDALRTYHRSVLEMLALLRCAKTLPPDLVPEAPQVCEVVAKPRRAYLDDGNTETGGTEYSLTLTCGLQQGAPPEPRELYYGHLTFPGLYFRAEIAVRNQDGQTWLPHCSACVVRYRDDKPRTSRFHLSHGSFAAKPSLPEWVQAVRDLQEAARDAEVLRDLEALLK